MPDWMSDIDPATAGGWLAAIAAAVAILRWMVPPLRRAARLLDELTGEPARPGHPRRPGLMERVANLEVGLATVESRTRELQHNGGGSIKDAVHRVDQALASDREE